MQVEVWADIIGRAAFVALLLVVITPLTPYAECALGQLVSRLWCRLFRLVGDEVAAIVPTHLSAM